MLRLTSIWALLQFDPQNPDYAAIAVPRLAAALTDERPRVRKEAAASLGRLGDKAGKSVPQLQKALQDEVPEVRVEVIAALAEMGAASSVAVPDLLNLLAEPDPAIRFSAIFALGTIGAPAKDAVPVLNRLVKSRNILEQTVAAWALVNITPDAETVKLATPILIRALQKSPRVEARLEAAKTLGKIGKGSAAIETALKTALEDGDESVRTEAQQALAKLKK
jgi:HEAT repeat protein